MTERLDKHVLQNGMVVLGEPMEAVGSVAFGFMLPAGVSLLPEGCCGAGNVILDWIFRGAGERNSRELGDALDGLGLHRAGSVSSSHIAIGSALESSNLAKALELYGSVILEGRLEDTEVLTRPSIEPPFPSRRFPCMGRSRNQRIGACWGRRSWGPR